MAHISDLRAGIFTYLFIFKGTQPTAALSDTPAECAALFVTPTAGHVVRLPSVR
jgi:hypothetical protein